MQIQKNKRADTLAGIVISIFILSFTLLGVINILDYNNDLSSNYNIEINEYILKSNSENIIKKLDTSNIENNEIFYIHKNNLTNNYDIYTGAINEEYKYIDKLGNKVDPNINLGKTYIREFKKELDILRHILEPNEIPNLVFHLDSLNAGSIIISGNEIDDWLDISGNGNDANKIDDTKRPIYNLEILDGKAGIEFDGVDDILKIDNSILINSDSIYNNKTIAIVFKTGLDINTTQIIYEQGGLNEGYNFIIRNKRLYISAFNNNWDSGHDKKIVELGKVIQDTIYSVMLTQDSSSGIDSSNIYKVYLNGELLGTLDHINPQTAHNGGIGLGGAYDNSREMWGSYNPITCTDCQNFKGAIGELISWNYSLSDDEVKGVQNYLTQKWLRGESNIYYNVITTYIKKFEGN